MVSRALVTCGFYLMTYRLKEILICGASPAVKKVLQSVKVLERIGQKAYFESKDAAIHKARQFDLPGTVF